MPDDRKVPTPDEVDSWAAGASRSPGLFRRFFPRKTIQVAEGVGEAATKAAAGTSADLRRTSEPAPSAHETEPSSPGRPRPISFAPGVLEHEVSEPSPRVVDAPPESADIPLEDESPHAAVPQPPPEPRRAGGLTIVLPSGRPPEPEPSAGPQPLIEVRGLSLFELGEERREEGPTPCEEDADGIARLYRIEGPGRIDLELADVSWDNGERSVMLVDAGSSPSRFAGLVRRLRMSVLPTGDQLVVELSAAMFTRPDRPSLAKVDVADLGRRIGVDIEALLRSAGGLDVGTKEGVLGVRHRRRDYWCVVFDEGSTHVPVIAFMLMRVLPLFLLGPAPGSGHEQTPDHPEVLGGRVLVVEPHQPVRDGLVRYLGDHGLEIVGTAQDGAEALRLVEALRPDLVTTEVNLPVVDGLALAVRIRERFPDVRVIILTVYPDEQFKQEALDAGVAAYLLKSEQPTGVLGAIRDALSDAGDATAGPMGHEGVGHDADEAAAESELAATEEAARRTYQQAVDRWGRTLLRGSRDGLAEAAVDLRAMGPVGEPWADKLSLRVAELDEQEERRQRLLRWCERSPAGRLEVVGEQRGLVGWVSTAALSVDRADRAAEDGRRLLMISVAREASRIEEGATGASARLQLSDVPDGTLVHEVTPAFEWRFDETRDFPPPPGTVVQWWRSNRGWVSVRCSVHGEIARFDVSDHIGMLCPAWDAAVVEYHNRWERAWDETYDTPAYDGCSVTVEPTADPGGPNLLDIEQMWIVTEGATRPWWPYDVLSSGSDAGVTA